MIRAGTTVAALVWASIAAFSTPADACDCAWVARDERGGTVALPGPPPLEAADRITARYVFVGTVVGIEDRHWSIPGYERFVFTAKLVTFDVTRVWKGRPGARVAVYGGTGIDCEYPFEVGTTYVVFANRMRRERREEIGADPDATSASFCGRTAPIDEATDLVDRLDRFRKGRPPR